MKKRTQKKIYLVLDILLGILILIALAADILLVKMALSA